MQLPPPTIRDVVEAALRSANNAWGHVIDTAPDFKLAQADLHAAHYHLNSLHDHLVEHGHLRAKDQVLGAPAPLGNTKDGTS